MAKTGACCCCNPWWTTSPKCLGWCGRINELPPEHRSNLPWHYVLLGEDAVHEWQGKGARLADLLDHARLRPQADHTLQMQLAW